MALDAGRLGSWEIDPESRVLSASASCKGIFGRTPDEPFTYDDLLKAIHPDDRADQHAAVSEALRELSDLETEYRLIRPDGAVRRIKISGRVVGKDDRLTLVGVSQDVTDIRQQDERQRILMHELNHRVKNTLATVQSIARMTHRSRGVPDDVWLAFSHRIEGLAKTHNLLTASNWEGANLHDILASELEPYQDRLRQRIRLRGPRVFLNARGVLAFGLALHELATNAAKYGSLSVEGGHLAVTWNVRSEESGRILHLEWVERNGPPVTPPTREGFGTRLLERVLATQGRACVKIEYLPEGLRFTAEIPLQPRTEAESDPNLGLAP